MSKNDDIGGVWRTVGGRRIFIRDGQDLATAMKESGKFLSAKKNKHKEKQLTVKEQKEMTSDMNELHDKGFIVINKQTEENLNKNTAEYFKKFHSNDEISKINGVQMQENLSNMEKNWCNEQLKYLSDLTDEYYSNIISIGYKKTTENTLGGLASNNYDMSVLMFQNEMIDKQSYFNKYINSSKVKYNKNGFKTNFNAIVDDNNIEKAVIYHEFAHSLTNSDNKYRREIGKELQKVYNDYVNELDDLETKIKVNKNKILFGKIELFDETLKTQERRDNMYISEYAYRNWEEFASECFANGKLNSNPSPYSLEIIKIIDKYYRRK